MKKSNPLNISIMRALYENATEGQWLVGANADGHTGIVTAEDYYPFGGKGSQAALDASFAVYAKNCTDTLLNIAEQTVLLDIQEIINLLPADNDNVPTLVNLLNVLKSEVDA